MKTEDLIAKITNIHICSMGSDRTYSSISKDNPADILTRHWGYQQVWGLMQPLLFWQGDTMDLVNKNGERLSKEDKDNNTVEPTVNSGRK